MSLKLKKDTLYINIAAPPVAAVQYVIIQYCPGALSFLKKKKFCEKIQ